MSWLTLTHRLGHKVRVLFGDSGVIEYQRISGEPYTRLPYAGTPVKDGGIAPHVFVRETPEQIDELILPMVSLDK